MPNATPIILSIPLHTIRLAGISLSFFTIAAKEVVKAIEECSSLKALNLQGNTLGVDSAKAVSKALEKHPEFEVCFIDRGKASKYHVAFEVCMLSHYD